MTDHVHTPVLIRECLAALNPCPGELLLDCTAGLGGHAASIAARLGPTGTVVLFDLDPANLQRAKARIEALPSAPRVITHHASFADAARRLTQGGLRADCLLADLGFASNQMDDPGRGLSFLRDGPLDMRLNPDAPITAAELVNSLPQPELADLIRTFGEDPAAGKIAAKLVQARQAAPISTTGQLAQIVRAASPRRPGQSIDPATRTFQALRIAVNDELGSLERLLDSIKRGATGGTSAASGSWLAPGARIAIISFHSLEDRPVKQAFADLVDRNLAEHLYRKPVTAADDELDSNPRARSAKLRAIRLFGSRSGRSATHPGSVPPAGAA